MKQPFFVWFVIVWRHNFEMKPFCSYYYFPFESLPPKQEQKAELLQVQKISVTNDRKDIFLFWTGGWFGGFGILSIVFLRSEHKHHLRQQTKKEFLTKEIFQTQGRTDKQGKVYNVLISHSKLGFASWKPMVKQVKFNKSFKCFTKWGKTFIQLKVMCCSVFF